MKYVVFLVALLIASQLTNSASAQWTGVGASTFTYPNVHDAHMAISRTNGDIYVVFTTGSFGNRVSVKKFDGSSWSDVGTPNFSTGYTSSPSIAIHPTNGEPYVAFLDQGSSSISVMRFNGTSWLAVGSGSPISATGINSLKLRFNLATAEPYVAFNNGTARVYKFDGVSWSNVGGSAGNAVTNIYTALDFEMNPLTNEPYLIFQYPSPSQHYRPVVKKYNGTAWVQVGGTVPDTAVTSPRIAFDSASGQPYILYCIGFASGGIEGTHCMTLNNGAWADVGAVLPFADDDVTLAVSPVTHRPYVGFTYGWSYVKKFDGYDWVNAGWDSGALSDVTDLQFHPITHELYKLFTPGTQCRVTKFGYCNVGVNTTAIACTRYMRPNGRFYTVSGIYSDTLVGPNFCDSIITLNLTVKTVDTSVMRSGNVWMANQAGAAYQWFNCWGADIPGATSQTYTLAGSGSVAVRITFNGCTERSTCPPPPLGITGATIQDEVQFYPNPTNGTLFILLGHNDVKLVEIYDAMGRCVARKIPDAPQIEIPVEGPAGIYTARIFSKSRGTMVYRVVKQ